MVIDVVLIVSISNMMLLVVLSYRITLSIFNQTDASRPVLVSFLVERVNGSLANRLVPRGLRGDLWSSLIQELKREG